MPSDGACATADGAAKARADYTSKSGSLTFNPGETTKAISVEIVSDSLTEANEILFVNLSNAINAVFADHQGLGTVLNDD